MLLYITFACFLGFIPENNILGCLSGGGGSGLLTTIGSSKPNKCGSLFNNGPSNRGFLYFLIEFGP